MRRTHAGNSRFRTVIGTAAVAALLLTGCSGGSGGGDGGEASEDNPVTIRFSWWGSDTRAALTEEAIAGFEAMHPEINVEPEPSAFDGYFDRLATSTAAGDAPDVITLGGAYPLEYAARNALLPLSDVSEQLDTSKFDDAILSNATYEDNLYGLPTGANTISLVANPRIFEEAGVPLPDDDEWTWDEFVDISNEISANTPDGVFGYESQPDDMDRVYIAQRGEPMYSEDGKLDVNASTMEEYWEMIVELRDGGGMPSAELTSEVVAAAPEQTLMGQGRSAMVPAYSNQLATLAGASGDELVLLKFPGETEYERPGMTLLPSQYFTIGAGTEHPEESAMLIDYLLNSTEAGEIMLTDRGMPANADIRSAISDKLDASQQAELEFIDDVAAKAGEGLPPQPAGAGIHNDLTIRLESDVLFDRLSPAEAAQQWVDELASAIGTV
jgi:multiple sugar transport system substrate-binding protein